MERMPLEVQNLYTELLDRLSTIDAHRSIGHVPGAFLKKMIKDETYYYFQYSDPGGIKRLRFFLSSSKIVQAMS